MENNENIICRAVIGVERGRARIIGILFSVVPFLIDLIWNYVEYSAGHRESVFFDNTDNNLKCQLFGKLKPVSYSACFFTVIAVIFVMFIIIPPILDKAYGLALTEDNVYARTKGNHKHQIPIDHVDNVIVSRSLTEAIFGGERLVITSNSGALNIHYVRNAEEFARATLKRIDENRESASAISPAQTFTGGDAMEKINSLKQMLDSGLISQEDFDRKKADILSKM